MNFRDLSRNCMARDKALYDGPRGGRGRRDLAAIADEALDLIEVEYEVLPHVIDVEAAMADGAPLLHDDMFTQGVEPKPTKPSNIAKKISSRKGDIAEGFAEAEVVVERQIHDPAGASGLYRAACLRRRGRQSTARRRSGARARASSWSAPIAPSCSASTSPTSARSPAEIGGGFGGKTLVYLEPVALALSKKCGRPVKMVMSREEVFRATGPTSGGVIEVKIGAKKDGTHHRRRSWC